MIKRLATLGLVLGAVSSIAIASPASASWTCVGTQQTAGFCFEATKSTIYEDCVYTGGTTCTTVRVPGYDVDCGGWILGSQFICTF